MNLQESVYMPPGTNPELARVLTKWMRECAILVNRRIYQVGAIYITVDPEDPAITLGYGTWQPFGVGRVLVGVDTSDTDFDTVEETGGSKTA